MRRPLAHAAAVVNAPARPFLTAEWRQLAMLNYVVAPGLLQPRVPAGTELDLFLGHAFVSLVAFRFLGTKVLGLPIPFHRNFEEVNLRFYVRRDTPAGPRRGVVFIREIVPRRAIAAVARWAYNENYVALPMSSEISSTHGAPQVRYSWRAGNWTHLRLSTAGQSVALAENSAEQFITEHYWGYGTDKKGRTLEYQVTHPPWRTWPVTSATLEGDTEKLYGPTFAASLRRPPDSAFLADGSPVVVYPGQIL
ncbi:MAG: DUF2071 domain-containing protein [Opitutales bacterium]